MTTAIVRFTKVFPLLCVVGAMMILAPAAWAQQPAVSPRRGERTSVPERIAQFYAEFDEDSLREAPQREVEFQTKPPQKVRIKTLEYKFVASMVLVHELPNSDDATRLRIIGRGPYQEQASVAHSFPETLAQLLFPEEPLFYRADGHSFPPLKLKSNSDYFKYLIEHCPEDKRPADAVTEFLSSDAADRDMTQSDKLFNGQTQWSFVAYGSTEDEARQRVEGLLPLFDYGLCLPLQRHCLAEGRKALDAARTGYEELPKKQEALRMEVEKLAKPSEITPDILTQLKAQKVLVAVEMAGLNARVNACNQMLKEEVRTLNPQVRESINDMKVRAEVELIGTKEKLDRINAFITEGNERETLRATIARLQSDRANLLEQIRRDEQRAELYARLVMLYAPLAVKDNQITVSPIEWTN